MVNDGPSPLGAAPPLPAVLSLGSCVCEAEPERPCRCSPRCRCKGCICYHFNEQRGESTMAIADQVHYPDADSQIASGYIHSDSFTYCELLEMVEGSTSGDGASFLDKLSPGTFESSRFGFLVRTPGDKVGPATNVSPSGCALVNDMPTLLDALPLKEQRRVEHSLSFSIETSKGSISPGQVLIGKTRLADILADLADLDEDIVEGGLHHSPSEPFWSARTASSPDLVHRRKHVDDAEAEALPGAAGLEPASVSAVGTSCRMIRSTVVDEASLATCSTSGDGVGGSTTGDTAGTVASVTSAETWQHCIQPGTASQAAHISDASVQQICCRDPLPDVLLTQRCPRLSGCLRVCGKGLFRVFGVCILCWPCAHVTPTRS